jgi:hypothetical protein
MQERPLNFNPAKARCSNAKKTARRMIQLAELMAEKLPFSMPPGIEHLLSVLEGKGPLDGIYCDSPISKILLDRGSAESLHRTIGNFNSRKNKTPLAALENIIESDSFSPGLLPMLERVSEIRQEHNYNEDGKGHTFDSSHIIQKDCLGHILSIMGNKKMGDLGIDMLKGINENASRAFLMPSNGSEKTDQSKSEYMLHYVLKRADSLASQDNFSKEMAPFVFEIIVSKRDLNLLLELSLANCIIGNRSLSAVSKDINLLRGFFYDISEKMMKITSAIENDPERMRVYLSVVGLIMDESFNEERLRIFKFLISRIETVATTNEESVNMLHDIERYIFSPWMREPFHKSPLFMLLKKPLTPQSHETIRALDMIAASERFDKDRMYCIIDAISKKDDEASLCNSYRRFLKLIEGRKFNPRICPMASALFMKGYREDFDAIFGFLEALSEKDFLNRVLLNKKIANALEMTSNGFSDVRSALKSLGLCMTILGSRSFAAEPVPDSFSEIPERTRGQDLYNALISFNSMLMHYGSSGRIWEKALFIIRKSKGDSLSISLDLFSTMIGKGRGYAGRMTEKELSKIIFISNAASGLGADNGQIASIILYDIFESKSFGMKEMDLLYSRLSKSPKRDIMSLLDGKPQIRSLIADKS